MGTFTLKLSLNYIRVLTTSYPYIFKVYFLLHSIYQTEKAVYFFQSKFLITLGGQDSSLSCKLNQVVIRVCLSY